MSAKPFYIHAECTVENTLTEDDIFDILEHLNKVGASIAATPGETRLNLSLTVEAWQPARAAETAMALISMATTETGLGDVTITTMEIRDEPTFNTYLEELNTRNENAAHAEWCRHTERFQSRGIIMVPQDPEVVIETHADAVAMALCTDFYTDMTGSPVDDPEALWEGIEGNERKGFIQDATVAMRAFYPLLEKELFNDAADRMENLLGGPETPQEFIITLRSRAHRAANPLSPKYVEALKNLDPIG